MRQFHEIIDARRQAIGLTVEEVFARLERYPWPAGTKAPALASLGHWFNGTRKRPRDMNHVKAICDVLELEVGEAFGAESSVAQTDMEQVILQKVRKLSAQDQEFALAMLDRLAAQKSGG